MNLYERLADDIAQGIADGVLRAGERLPSVRELRRRRGVSAATVMQGYALLERRGLVEARPRSGYFVATAAAPAVAGDAGPAAAADVAVSDLVFAILGATRERRLLPFGSAFPSPLLFPLERLANSLARSARRLDPWASVADLPPGSAALRREIARRLLASGVTVAPDDLLITNGAMEALSLSLQAVTSPGDVVAIESPTFYAPLQAIERLGLRAVEVRTDPSSGIDADSLRAVLDAQPVRACWFMGNFHNPTGATVPEARRREVVQLLAERGIPLIEDDVYAELYFGRRPLRPFKSFDTLGEVLYCGSFSKCLAPGFRIGWVAAGRHAERVVRLKAMSSLATSVPSQEALADYLQRGGFEAHLRRLRRALRTQRDEMLQAIAAHFPAGTRATRADGGYFIWVELPGRVDALALHRRATAEGIGLSPGPMFSPRGGYRHCIRLNYGHPWDDALRAGIARLGALARALAEA
ncbi:MAG: PLP-dependent aminotransferase family protein [Pseudomonadota bacterium]|nr:PLP-dependent aminotransferase family protein [Pseudomonadota bacterium]